MSIYSVISPPVRSVPRIAVQAALVCALTSGPVWAHSGLASDHATHAMLHLGTAAALVMGVLGIAGVVRARLARDRVRKPRR